MNENVATQQTILVVGGGISGMTAALEAAEYGKDVVLLEKGPTLGGRTAGLDGQVIRAKKLEEIAVKVIPTKK